jgi:hypothetical protein
MKLTCTVSHLANGKWLARHTGSSVGQVEVTALTREEALTKMRNELQYRIEWCPCSGASGDTVELQVREEGGRAMNDDTRKLLKVFGVAVTDAEAEAERLAGTAAQLSASAGKEEVARLLKDASELCRELNTRWLEITQRAFAIQTRLQQQLAEAGVRLQATK